MVIVLLLSVVMIVNIKFDTNLNIYFNKRLNSLLLKYRIWIKSGEYAWAGATGLIGVGGV
jgi:hypothetical protein